MNVQKVQQKSSEKHIDKFRKENYNRVQKRERKEAGGWRLIILSLLS